MQPRTDITRVFFWRGNSKLLDEEAEEDEEDEEDGEGDEAKREKA
jgi:hypothetical protein